jgi:hypothetical protein
VQVVQDPALERARLAAMQGASASGVADASGTGGSGDGAADAVRSRGRRGSGRPAAASAPVQISSEALPGETAPPSSGSVVAQLAVFSDDDLVDLVEAELMRPLSGHGILPRTQSAAPAAHSQHDPESRHPSVSKFPKKIGKGMPAPSGKLPRRRIRSKQPQAASMARPKRVRIETRRGDWHKHDSWTWRQAAMQQAASQHAKKPLKSTKVAMQQAPSQHVCSWCLFLCLITAF